jgi:transcriptional regulator with XRE-family HTH domain
MSILDLTKMAKKPTIKVMLDTEKIRQLRESKDLTMEQAASAAGLASRQRWFQIESGAQTNIELSTLNSLATALGVNAKELLK